MGPSESEQLPEGWARCYDENYGLEYFFDLVNQRPQWHRPEAPAVAGSAAGNAVADAQFSGEAGSATTLPEGWVERMDPTHGIPYYFDLVNERSQWEVPTSAATADNGDAGAAIIRPADVADEGMAADADVAPSAPSVEHAQSAERDPERSEQEELDLAMGAPRPDTARSMLLLLLRTREQQLSPRE